jgi:radical SAM protein with 4Fe4S-binding SPASM domain
MTAIKLPPDTVVIERDRKYLFLVPSKPDWVVTNANGAFCLSLCDGTRTTDQLLNDVAEKHGDTAEARAFLNFLVADGFFSERDPTASSQVMSPRLRSVHLNMSPDCNLKCNYCYAEERSVEGLALSVAEYKVLIDELANMAEGIHIAFTGGEPLLNKHTPELSAYCRGKGFYTYLLTNGTPILEKNVHLISRSFDEIRISVDGSSAEIHDFHRGPGTYAKTMTALKLLDDQGAQVRVAMTVTKHNIGDISNAAKKFGSRFMFQPLFNAGNAKLNAELAITGDEYYEALATADGVEPMARVGAVVTSLKNRGTTKCAIGDTEISISHCGDVYPCHMMHLKAYKAGNIREQSIQKIYLSSPVLAAARQLTIAARPECSECAIRLLCGGACRARAYYLAGDLNACDSFCDYEFAAFINGLFRSAELKSASAMSVCR